MNLIQFKPLRGTALFVIEPRMVFEVVDNLFGGNSQFHTRIEGRDFTATEMGIVRRLLDVILAVYKEAWSPVYQIEPELIRSELNPQFANIATPHEIVVTTSFRFEFANAAGDMHLCMPYSMIEPIRAQLSSPMQSDHISTDTRWETTLRHEIMDTEVEVNIEYATKRMSAGEFMKIKPGDILPITLSEPAVGYVEGIPIAHATPGRSGGHNAFRFEHLAREPKVSEDKKNAR